MALPTLTTHPPSVTLCNGTGKAWGHECDVRQRDFQFQVTRIITKTEKIGASHTIVYIFIP